MICRISVLLCARIVVGDLTQTQLTLISLDVVRAHSDFNRKNLGVDPERAPKVVV